ncbi:hypothetical protein [Actinocorallia libanotica]|uniref:Core-binding (CB) domain-containing protein n=1 Tax=Actinocorallia libanotica TaxID=46162 RepID=A0ABN1Q2E4_9ACTN
MDLGSATDHYLIHLETVLGYSRGTVSQRSRILRRFTGWLEELGVSDTTGITGAVMERIVVGHLADSTEAAAHSEREQPLAERTANLYKSQLRGYLAWLGEEGHLGEDPSPERKLVSRRSPKPAKAKTFVHRREIHHAAGRARQWHPRDEAWVYFQHYLGRRYVELAPMRVRHLDLTPRPGYPCGVFVYDNVKARKYNISGQIEPEFVPIAQAWLKEYAQLLGRPLRPDDHLIPALSAGKGACLKGVRRPLKLVPDKPASYDAVEEALKRAGIPASHALRRGEASYLTQKYGIRAAKTMLGHSSQATTEGYVDYDQEVVDLGEMFARGSEEQRGPQEAPAFDREAVAVVDFSERRRRRLGSAWGA